MRSGSSNIVQSSILSPRMMASGISLLVQKLGKCDKTLHLDSHTTRSTSGGKLLCIHQLTWMKGKDEWIDLSYRTSRSQ